jgi:hypothetical protein
MRAFAAVPVAIMVCLAAPAFADAGTHVKAAKRAERRREWRRALQEWKAAYAAELNAEYLIGIGDAQAKLGNKAEAKKSYEAYLADPLALPRNVQKVQAKLARLEAPSEGLALPGPGLTLPGAAPPASAARTVEAPLPLPGLDAPESAPPAASADRAALPPLPLPGMPPAKKDQDKIASVAPPLPLPLPGVIARSDPAAKKEGAAALASKEPGKTPAKPIAMVTPERPVDKAPAAALEAMPMPRERSSSSGIQRTMAYVTAGVAIAALGGGALAYTKASSAHDDLTSKVHSGADAQRLLENERSNKTLSFVGFAGGLVAAGIATALFAF